MPYGIIEMKNRERIRVRVCVCGVCIVHARYDDDDDAAFIRNYMKVLCHVLFITLLSAREKAAYKMCRRNGIARMIWVLPRIYMAHA